MQLEFTQLLDEITRIAEVTEFNGQRLVGEHGQEKVLFSPGNFGGIFSEIVDLEGPSFDTQIGMRDTPNDRISFQLDTLSSKALGLREHIIVSSLNIGEEESTFDLLDANRSREALGIVDAAIAKGAKSRAKIGAYQKRLDVTVANLQVTHENISSAEARIRDADVALETAEFPRNQMLVSVGISVLGQGNVQPSLALFLILELSTKSDSDAKNGATLAALSGQP